MHLVRGYIFSQFLQPNLGIAFRNVSRHIYDCACFWCYALLPCLIHRHWMEIINHSVYAIMCSVKEVEQLWCEDYDRMFCRRKKVSSRLILSVFSCSCSEMKHVFVARIIYIRKMGLVSLFYSSNICIKADIIPTETLSMLCMFSLH